MHLQVTESWLGGGGGGGGGGGKMESSGEEGGNDVETACMHNIWMHIHTNKHSPDGGVEGRILFLFCLGSVTQLFVGCCP